MVGRRHQREADAPQSPGWGCEEIPDRICGTLSSRRSSANHQQSLRTQEPSANHDQHALGALLSRGVASQSTIHTGRVHNLREKLDCSTLGQSTTRTSQNCRGRALATSDRSCGWNQSQNQMCDVGFVFACRSVEILWLQSHLFRDTGREWRQARPEHWRADQRQTSEIPFSFVTGTGQAWFSRTGVSGSVARVPRRSLGYTSRRTRGATLAVVRFRQHEHQRPTLVLLASRWKPEEHKNGSIRKTTVDASKPEAFLTGVEVAKPLQRTGNFVFPSERLRGSKPLDPASVLRKKIQPAFRRIGITVWAGTPFGTRWNHAGGDGRTSAHNPRLLAAQQPSSHEQVLAGNIEDQRLAQDKLVDSILPTGILPKTNLIQ